MPIQLQDFDKLIDKWAERWAKEHGSSLLWRDYNHTHFILEERHLFIKNEHRLFITCDKITDEHIKPATKPILEKRLIPQNKRIVYENPSDEIITYTYIQSQTLKDEARVEITQGINCGLGVTLDFPTSFVGIQPSFSFEYSQTKTQETVKGKERVETVEVPVPCLPKKMTYAQLVIKENIQVLEFTQTAKLSGFIVICCNDKVKHFSDTKSHRKWPIPIKEVFENLRDWGIATPDFTLMGDKINFELKGQVEIKTQHCAVENKNFDPIIVEQYIAEMQKSLKEYYTKKLELKRLYYPQSIPLHEHYIHLSMVTQSDYQQSVKYFEQTLRQESQLEENEEIREHYTQLFGHETRSFSINDVMDIFFPKKNLKPFSEEKDRQYSALITGTAGIGKTTLSRELCRLAMYEEWGKCFKWIFNIPLRNLTAERYQDTHAYRLIDIFYNECLHPDKISYVKKPTDDEVNAIGIILEEDLKAGKVLIILDGFDEAEHLPSHLEPLFKQLLHSPRVIVTSRPYNLQSLNDYYGFQAKNRYEITGFTHENVKQYVTDFFQSFPQSGLAKEELTKKAELLIQHIEKNPNILGFFRIPINLELGCTVHAQQSLEEDDLSLSRLNNRVILSLCRRYLIKNPNKVIKENDRIINKEKEIPRWLEDEIFIECRQELIYLERLAFESLVREKLFFKADIAYDYFETIEFKEERGKKNKILSQQEYLGLIRPNNPTGAFDRDSNYYFPHMTIRDVLAARYIAGGFAKIYETMKSSDYWQYHYWKHAIALNEFVSENRLKSSYEIVWWFVAGILSEREQFKALQYFLGLILNEPKNSFYFSLGSILLLIRLLDEGRKFITQCPPEIRKLLFHPIQQWLRLSLDSNNMLFSDNENNQLWQRLKLSAWLFYQPEIEDTLLNILLALESDSASSEDLLRLARCCRIINFFSNKVIEKLLKVYGKQIRRQITQEMQKFASAIFYEINLAYDEKIFLEKLLSFLEHKDMDIQLASLQALSMILPVFIGYINIDTLRQSLKEKLIKTSWEKIADNLKKGNNQEMQLVSLQALSWLLPRWLNNCLSLASHRFQNLDEFKQILEIDLIKTSWEKNYYWLREK